MANFNTSTPVDNVASEHSLDSSDYEKLSGIFDVLVQMDLAQNGYPTQSLYSLDRTVTEAQS